MLKVLSSKTAEGVFKYKVYELDGYFLLKRIPSKELVFMRSNGESLLDFIETPDTENYSIADAFQFEGTQLVKTVVNSLYSDAMISYGIEVDEADLLQWLASLQKLIPKLKKYGNLHEGIRFN